MGNCAAPGLAILFMNYVEQKINEQCADVLLWKRYIDDVFFVTKGTGSSLLRLANSIHPSIQFTLETSTNNQLPFLDTLVHHNSDGSFSTELFIKPSHSGTCLPFSAFAPLSRKKGLIISETLRAQRISSPHLLQPSLDKVTERLLNNEYPQRLINTTRRHIDPEFSNQPDFISFLKVPFLGENQRQQILRHQKKTFFADKIRIVFIMEPPSHGSSAQKQAHLHALLTVLHVARQKILAHVSRRMLCIVSNVISAILFISVKLREL
jgi:hypothetical protein